MAAASITDTDKRNIAFWNELCGSQLARDLGITDASPASLKKFDDWYMDFYPYLYNHIPFADLKGKKVLEVGLGYGTVAQLLAAAACDYHGLDIADGPVRMVNHRLQQANLPGRAIQGSILDCAYSDETFDWVVTIGCLHHTGNLQLALDEIYRILKPGGHAIVMVYYAYSYRRWLRNFASTFRHFMWEKANLGAASSTSERERAQYDSALDGSGAPETVFTSRSQLEKMCRPWSGITICLENTGGEGPLRLLPRDLVNRTIGKTVGLDMYCRLQK